MTGRDFVSLLLIRLGLALTDLETHPAELDGCRTVLELGSGTGWLGMMVARNAPAVERIYLSEMLEGGAFAWLQHNVSLNLTLTLTPFPSPDPNPRPGPAPNQVGLNAALSLRAVQAIPCDWAWFGASGDAEEEAEVDERSLDVAQAPQGVLIGSP